MTLFANIAEHEKQALRSLCAQIVEAPPYLKYFNLWEGTIRPELVEEIKARPSRWCSGRFSVMVVETLEATGGDDAVYCVVLALESDEDSVMWKLRSKVGQVTLLSREQVTQEITNKIKD